MTTALQTFQVEGKEFVILEKRQYDRIVGKIRGRSAAVKGDVPLPTMPGKLPSCNYPAIEALRADLARDLIKRRWAAHLTQAELARRAGIRHETLNRLERTKVTPDPATVRKIVGALEKAERKMALRSIPMGGSCPDTVGREISPPGSMSNE